MADADLLHDVLARLDALERDNEQLKQGNVAQAREIDTLKEQNAALLARVEPRSTPIVTTAEEPASPLERMSRRWVLRRGLQVGAATVAASVVARQVLPEAEAHHGNHPFVWADWVSAHHVNVRSADSYGVLASTTTDGEDSASGVEGTNDGSGPGVRGISRHGTGVKGHGIAGIAGYSRANGYEGVYGKHEGTAGYGVVGDGVGETGAGVLGRNDTGTGIIGESKHAGYGGVFGHHKGTQGYGVIGIGTGAGSGVSGSNGTGDGVSGTGKVGVRGTSSNGVGVAGEGGSGYGGTFQGTRAQVRLVPTARTGKPTTSNHQKGELYLDNAGTLFICTAGTAGTTPAQWKRVNTTAV